MSFSDEITTWVNMIKETLICTNLIKKVDDLSPVINCEDDLLTYSKQRSEFAVREKNSDKLA